jgi:predicted GNAT family acetyltransferase
MDAGTVTVVHVPDRRRYELRDGEKVIGAAHYRRRPGQVVFTHTVVDDAYEGQGLGAELARQALTDVKESGLRIVPVCPFIAAYLRRHHEYDDVVDPVPVHEEDEPRG